MLNIGERLITIQDYYNVLFKYVKVGIYSEAAERIKKSYDFLDSFHKNKIIYGINTGLGPMAQYRIDEADRLKLHYNAIRSHASGCGDAVNPIYVRSAMVTLLSNFSHGYSGMHPEVIDLIRDLVNLQIIPVVPEHGGVGASGDLVQLAHIALVLIGEGEVFCDGKIANTAEVFRKHSLKPITIHLREGLSLINGTCFMTGTGIVNVMHAWNLLRWAITVACMINEIVRSFDDYFSAELNGVKKQNGQNRVAEIERRLLNDSKLIRKREEHFFNGKHSNDYVIADKVQEYYSIRCVPQILGPIYDTIEYTEKILLNEANSASDNPVVHAEKNNIFHGGNFHGDYISLEMDKLKIVMTKLSMLLERQVNYLMNDRLNSKLPPFVNLGKLGVNFGMQGSQFTATSTVAENQTLSFPNYVHSISNNNDNQDIVSMGTNSAQFARKVIDNTYQVLAIELLTIVQSIDYLNIESRMSSYTRDKYSIIRSLVPRFEEDTIKYIEIKRIKDYLCNQFISIQ
ncbi:MAG TPA: aromatic amino acid ammonia-lyase [Bacteroidales bacterium]|jgi:histidine ammonia-lyase|nr:aromatic amino acid ammonia-lyase [Bacteroidales bacterium]